MELLTKIDISQFAKKIDLNSRIMLLGSCFSTSIGQMLQSYGFNTCVNPFGVLFNPASIANACERLANPQPFNTNDVIDISQNRTCTNQKLCESTHSISESEKQRSIEDGSRYCSFSHHSSFARSSAQEFLNNANALLAQAAEFFKQADTLIITLGTAYVFRHLARNIIVSNCHKIVPQEFSRELLTIGQGLECLKRITEAAKGKHIIFTVSPVRHLADGAHGNMLSKSTLLHAINGLIMDNELSPVENDIDYFPAFEIMMDELRDYRFYAEDMVHPSEVAVKYIFERFTEVAIEEPCKPQMIAAHKKWLFQQHNAAVGHN